MCKTSVRIAFLVYLDAHTKDIACTMKTADELCEYLDIEFSRVVDEATRQTSGMDATMRAATISGFLIKTGIKLSVKHVPQDVAEMAVLEVVREQYGS